LEVKVVSKLECWECNNPWRKGEMNMATLQRRIRRSRGIKLCREHSRTSWIVGYWQCLKRGGKHRFKD